MNNKGQVFVLAFLIGILSFVIGVVIAVMGHIAVFRNRGGAADRSTAIESDVSGDAGYDNDSESGEFTTETDDEKSITSSAKGILNDIESAVTPKEKLSYFEKLFEEGPLLAWDENLRAGYINKSGEWVIQPQFSEGHKFSEGFASVKDKDTGMWGFIDTEGNFVIPPQYGSAGSFIDGCAPVSIETYKNFGLINTRGEYVIEPIYSEVSHFKEGYAIVKEYDTNQYFFVDKSGKKVFGGYFEAYLFEDGMAVVCEGGAHGGWLKLHKDGSFEEFAEPIFDVTWMTVYGDTQCDYYIDLSGEYVVKNMDEMEVMINRKGDVLSPPFEDIDSFGMEGLARAKRDGKYGFVDKNFNWVIEPKYYYASSFINGLAYIQDTDFTNSEGPSGLIAFIDTSGNTVLDGNERNGRRVSLTSIGYAYEDKSIPLLASEHYEDPTNMKFGYVDWNYNEVLPFIYDSAQAFAGDGSYAIAKYNGLFGMIDRNGNWLIEPKFGSLNENKNGYGY